MARSRSRLQVFFRDHPLIVLSVPIIMACLLVAAIAITVQTIRGVSQPTAQSPAHPSSKNTSIPAPTPSASQSAVGVGPVSDEEDGLVNTDCSALLPKDEYDSLLLRVQIYEAAFIDPYGPNNNATVQNLATKDYIQAHAKTIDSSIEDPTQRTSLDSFQGVSCNVISSTSVIVQTISNTTYYENKDGSATNQLSIVRSITMGWLKQDGIWLVNAEEE